MRAVEIKVTVRPDQELRAERAMQVDEDSADVRVVYFYDTPDLDLFDQGVALRARLVKGDAEDSTVKFRPAEKSLISEAWQELEGFKLEADWVGDNVVCSASLTQPQQSDRILAVAEGKRGIDKLFSKDQERFLTEFAKHPIDIGSLCVMGPIRVLRWKLRHGGFAHQLCVEEWRLPDGDDLVEISIKAPPEGALQARRAFDNHLLTLGLDARGAQQTKTRTALEYFAKTYRHAAA
jgi:hypothetical protein